MADLKAAQIALNAAQHALGMTDEQATEMLGMMASQVAGGPASGGVQQ